MGTLVLDIETASPFEEPPMDANETQYFEWVAVGLAYADDLNETPETDVLFRRGTWDDAYTRDLFEQLFERCNKRSVERLLTCIAVHQLGSSDPVKTVTNSATAQ